MDGTTDAVARPGCGTRFGFLVAAAVNAVVLWVAHQLLEWEWPRFLTDGFDETLPLLSLSLGLSIVANLSFVLYSGRRYRAAWDAVTGAVSVAFGVRLLDVFPFDFSTYARDWSWLVRTVVVIGIVGTAIATVVNLAKVVRPGPPPRTGTPGSHPY